MRQEAGSLEPCGLDHGAIPEGPLNLVELFGDLRLALEQSHAYDIVMDSATRSSPGARGRVGGPRGWMGCAKAMPCKIGPSATILSS